MLSGSKWRLVPATALLALGALLLLNTNLLRTSYLDQQFVHLAREFLRGNAHFTEMPSATWTDTSEYRGRHYWPLGPFPAVLLMPFVLALGTAMRQGFLSFFLSLLNGWLLFRTARAITRDNEASLWLTAAYILGTVYLFVALVPWSWYFAHVVATSLLMLAVHEALTSRRWSLAGLFVGLAVATRVTTAPGLLFFVLEASRERPVRLRRITALAVPVLLSVALLAAYNYVRFEDPLETGYRHQILVSEYQGNRALGLWSFVHFPANAYYLFLKGPDPVVVPGTMVLRFPYIRPDRWGMSIFLTSPIFLFLFRLRRDPENRTAYHALLTSLVILFFTLGNFGIGARQYGYRFALDFSPFLFVALAHVFRGTRFGVLPKIVVAFSFLLNLYLIPQLF